MKGWKACLLILVGACGMSSGPDGSTTTLRPDLRESPDGVVEARQLGTIEHYSDPVRIEVPDSASRGEDFEVVVNTYGGGCVAQGDTELQVDALTAEISPYDWEVVEAPPNTACTLELRVYRHAVSLAFDVAGSARIRVSGRRKPSGKVFTVVRQVEIR